MGRQGMVWFLTVLLLIFTAGSAAAEGQKGVLTITGVPEDAATGSYDPQEGIFQADVSDFPQALIKVEMEDMQISGLAMKWNTKKDQLIFSSSARLFKDDFELKGNVIEYFASENRLIAAGQVVAITADATVQADYLEYDEESDQALFTGNVEVIFADGTLHGEKLVLFVERGELQFFGIFRGEFQTDSN